MEIVAMIVGIIGAITGIAGLLVGVLIVRWQAKELTRTNRLTFLADRIFDTTIPRDLRLPFYEEYISMKGNGTAVRFWLIEGQKEQAAK